MILWGPIEVERKYDDKGTSWIEPPFDPKANELIKLQWHIGMIEADTGMKLMVIRHRSRVPGLPDKFSIVGPSSIHGPQYFDQIWADLILITRGVEWANALQEQKEKLHGRA